MQPRGVLAVIVLGVALAGCALLPGRSTFEGTFPEEDLVVGTAVSVQDATGLMTGLIIAPEIVPPPIEDGISEHPDGIVVTWLGGACDDSVSFMFERAGQGYTISGSTITLDRVCRLLGVQRHVLLVLRAPVSADTVGFTMGDPAN